MVRKEYGLALVCYLLIPVVLISGGGIFQLIDPEFARGYADYVRVYRWLELAREAVLVVAGGMALILWIMVGYLVLHSRCRSWRWLILMAAGPLGFSLIAMLEDQSPTAKDHYQHFIQALPVAWRVPLELAVFGSIWFLAYAGVVLQRELMIVVEAFSTGTPTSTIIARQDASSGMWAFGEGLEVGFLVVLIYLLWPIAFNVLTQLRMSRSH